MKINRRLAAVLFALCTFGLADPGFAQSTAPVVLSGGCGTGNAPQSLAYLTVDSTLKLCVDTTGSGTGFTPASPMQAGLAITSSTALTVPTGSTYAVVCARGANVDYTTDGTTTPTATVGMQLLQNQCVPLQGTVTIANFRAIQQSATATLDVSYFK